MLGNIISIEDSTIIVKLDIDIQSLENLINVHVIFERNDIRIVGEIVNMTIDTAEIVVYGEIENNKFVIGTSNKPSFNSIVRIITIEELYLVLGNQNITKDKFYLGISNVYKNFKINIDINVFFSNHFSILGNTGSGKSCSIARIIQNIFNKDNPPINSNIFLFDAYGEYENAFTNSQNITFKNYTTDIKDDKDKILRIPIWLLDVDDIVLLLDADKQIQLPIIEKALKLVNIFSKDEEDVLIYKNDIIARTLLDILLSGNDANVIRDQIFAILTTYSTEELSLDAKVHQIGYTRPLRQ